MVLDELLEAVPMLQDDSVVAVHKYEVVNYVMLNTKAFSGVSST